MSTKTNVAVRHRISVWIIGSPGHHRSTTASAPTDQRIEKAGAARHRVPDLGPTERITADRRSPARPAGTTRTACSPTSRSVIADMSLWPDAETVAHPPIPQRRRGHQPGPATPLGPAARTTRADSAILRNSITGQLGCHARRVEALLEKSPSELARCPRCRDASCHLRRVPAQAHPRRRAARPASPSRRAPGRRRRIRGVSTALRWRLITTQSWFPRQPRTSDAGIYRQVSNMRSNPSRSR